MTELAALTSAALHQKRDWYALKADKSAPIAAAEVKIQTLLYVETLHVQMLLSKYTEALYLSETGTAGC